MVSTRSSGARPVSRVDNPDRMLRPNVSAAKRLTPVNYVDSATQTIESSSDYLLTLRKPLDRTPGKHAREDEESADGERPSQRRQLTPAKNYDILNRVPYTAPAGRITRHVPIGASRTPTLARNSSKRPNISARKFIAQRNGNAASQPDPVTIHDTPEMQEWERNTPKQSSHDETREVSTQNQQGGSHHNNQDDLDDQDREEAAFQEVGSDNSPSQTPSRSIFGSLGRAFDSARKLPASLNPLNLFSKTTPATPTTPSTGTRRQAPVSPDDELPDDFSTPLPVNLFSGRPSYYGTPASEAHRLPSPKRKTNEQIEEQMRKEAEAVYKNVEEIGEADPEFIRQRQAAAADKPDTAPGQKRKLSAIDGKLPGPRSGGFGIDDSFLDQDNHIEGIDESLIDDGYIPETPQAKSQKTEKYQTPLKSALKKNEFAGLDSTSKRSARFNPNPVASTRVMSGNYGPAGQYTGNTFADRESTNSPASTTSQASDSLSSLDFSDVFSPTTQMNTRSNALASLERHIAFDKTYRDPANPDWKPSPANPRPGTFQVPDEEDFDEEDDSTFEEESVVSAPPASPRPAHAALPAVSPAGTTSVMSLDTSSFLADVSKINKAREQAEKFKPKESSRLSQVQQARSRSSSPPLSATNAAAGTTSESESSPPAEDGAVQSSNDAAVSTSVNIGHEAENLSSAAEQVSARPTNGLSRLVSIEIQPEERTPSLSSDNDEDDDGAALDVEYVEPDYDNTVVGEDGMTEHQRQHQYDDWAAGLTWPEPTLKKDAGYSTEFMEEYVTKNWTEEDDEQSSAFYKKEWKRLDRALKLAKDAGTEIQWV